MSRGGKIDSGISKNVKFPWGRPPRPPPWGLILIGALVTQEAELKIQGDYVITWNNISTFLAY